MQQLFLSLYKLVYRTGFMDTRLGKWLFYGAYNTYKRLLEAKDADLLQQLVQPGSAVLDVGANVGFFTTRFAGWVGEKGRVYAIEPEAKNIAQLKKTLSGKPIAERVNILEGVASDSNGTVTLALNPYHPADHKISTENDNATDTTEVEVNSYVIDQELENADWPTVSLAKIDVQGAEMMVLKGMDQLMQRQQPNIYIEVDDKCLKQFGTSAEALLDYLDTKGYRYHLFQKGQPTELSKAQVMEAITAKGYVDLLCMA